MTSLPPVELKPRDPSEHPNARYIIGGECTTIEFINDLPIGSSAKIYKIDELGRRTFWAAVLGLGMSCPKETTYLYQPWEVVFSRQGETVTKIYYPMPNPSLVKLDADVFPIRCLLPPCTVKNVFSSTGGASTTIKFENLLELQVKIFWVDENGNDRFYKKIPPGASLSEPTFVGQVWKVVSADYEERFIATPHQGIARIE